ncbi:hypothetical protein B566_EDAN007605 [Ephemera danica]|nr:hypothetical protein B566_EDAN007605 [Ephemera danica]
MEYRDKSTEVVYVPGGKAVFLLESTGTSRLLRGEELAPHLVSLEQTFEAARKSPQRSLNVSSFLHSFQVERVLWISIMNRIVFYVSFIVVFTTSRCEEIANVTEVNGQGPTCVSLAGCIQLGVLKGLNDIENSEEYSMFGKRLVLEKTGPQELKKGARTGIIQRAYRILDNHVVRARLSKSLALTLFRTPQGHFDLALEIGDTTSSSDGRTFFKRRLQMALLPIMYKLGVITTLMGGLVVMVAKGLLIGVILIMFAVAAAVKSKLLWSHHHEPHHGWSSPGIPYAHHTPPQDIHVHLHGIHKEAVLHKEYSVPSGSGHITAGGGDAYLGPYNRAAHGITT